MDLGLERIHCLLRALAPPGALHPPHETFSVIHVAGTNGKGSICAYLSHMLQASGYRVGRYNSPHLLIPRDTIQVDHQPISQQDYDALRQYVHETSKANKIEATSFEILTAVAFCYFAYGGVPTTTSSTPFVDIAVIEVGVGGRLDATNVIPQPRVCVIASIGMDHGALLGNTVDQITFEKAGIIKSGVPVIVAPQREGAAVYSVIEQRAKQVGASQVVLVEAAEWDDKEDHDDQQGWTALRTGRRARVKQGKMDPLDVWIPLLGDFQLENAAVAIAAIQALKDAGAHEDKDSDWSRITNLTIQQGMRNTVWPGRLQWIEPHGHGRSEAVRARMLVDGAHNPASAVALRAYIEECVSTLSACSSQAETTTPVHVYWIMAFTRGKDVNEMFDILFAPFAKVPTTRSSVSIVEYSSPEGMPWVSPMSSEEVREQLLTYAKAYPARTTVDEVQAFGTRLQDALDWVWNHNEENSLVVLCGSLYLVADLLRVHHLQPADP